MLEGRWRDVEGAIRVEAVGLLGEPDLVCAQGCAVRLLAAGLVRRAIADRGAHRDDRGSVVRARGFDRRRDGLDVGTVLDALGVPAVGVEALQDVFGPGHARGTVELDVVVVVEDDEPAQAQVAGQAGGLRRDALLEIPVRADDVRPVVDDVVSGTPELRRQPSLGDGHAHGVRETLAQRAGRGLDARREAVLGVARGP